MAALVWAAFVFLRNSFFYGTLGSVTRSKTLTHFVSLSPLSDLPGLFCGEKNASTPDRDARYGSPLLPREIATMDCLVCLSHPGAVALHWNIHPRSSLHN